MQNINSSIGLKSAIAELETKQTVEATQMRQQFDVVRESIQPVNLFKSAFHQIAESDEIKGNLVNTGIGWGAGYLSKVLFQGDSHSTSRKFLGILLMFGVSNFTAKHPVHIKAAALTTLDTILQYLPRPHTSGQQHSKENQQ